MRALFDPALVALNGEVVSLNTLQELLQERQATQESERIHNAEETHDRRMRRANEVLGIKTQAQHEPGTATDASSGGRTTTNARNEARRNRKMLVRVSNELVRSAWGSIDLHPEEQVRDFLTDMILDQPTLMRMLEFALLLGEHGHRVLDDSATVPARLGQLHDNIVLVLAAPLPKRAGQTLLHVRRGV